MPTSSSVITGGWTAAVNHHSRLETELALSVAFWQKLLDGQVV
jgi:hypothetical protein